MVLQQEFIKVLIVALEAKMIDQMFVIGPRASFGPWKDELKFFTGKKKDLQKAKNIRFQK